MWARMIPLLFVVGCAYVDNPSDVRRTPDDDQTAVVSQDSEIHLQCTLGSDPQTVVCVAQFRGLVFTIIIRVGRILDASMLNVLADDLANLLTLDETVLDINQILGDLEAVALDDLRNKFLIDVSPNDIDVCATVSGVQLCK